MADMAPIVSTINGTAYTFLLLEADIPILTFENMTGQGIHPVADSNYYGYIALIDAVGGKSGDYTEGYSLRSRSIFEPFVKDQYPRLIGKAVLSWVADRIEETSYQFLIETNAVLAMALKGGGLVLKAAGGTADTLQRNSPSAGIKFNYIQSVLAPQILRAAAAA